MSLEMHISPFSVSHVIYPRIKSQRTYNSISTSLIFLIWSLLKPPDQESSVENRGYCWHNVFYYSYVLFIRVFEYSLGSGSSPFLTRWGSLLTVIERIHQNQDIAGGQTISPAALIFRRSRSHSSGAIPLDLREQSYMGKIDHSCEYCTRQCSTHERKQIGSFLQLSKH